RDPSLASGASSFPKAGIHSASSAGQAFHHAPITTAPAHRQRARRSRIGGGGTAPAADHHRFAQRKESEPMTAPRLPVCALGISTLGGEHLVFVGQRLVSVCQP